MIKYPWWDSVRRNALSKQRICGGISNSFDSQRCEGDFGFITCCVDNVRFAEEAGEKKGKKEWI